MAVRPLPPAFDICPAVDLLIFVTGVILAGDIWALIGRGVGHS